MQEFTFNQPEASLSSLPTTSQPSVSSSQHASQDAYNASTLDMELPEMLFEGGCADETSFASVQSVSTITPLASPVVLAWASGNGAEKESGIDSKGRGGKNNGGPSFVWHFFIKIEGGKTARCKKCQMLFHVTNGGTTSLGRHLQSKHSITKDNFKQYLPDTLGNVKSTHQKTIPFTTQAWERQLCRFLVKQKLPYTFAEQPEFRELIHLARKAHSDDEITFPSNDTMATRVSQEKNRCEELVRDKIASVNKVAITLDTWMSQYGTVA